MPLLPSEPVERSGQALLTGTVTFLFTDIEGSTRLLHDLRDQYATVLADQRAILRAAFRQWHGLEIDTQGDSFFVAFSRAVDAIGATVDAQRAVAAHVWPQGAIVRVRMGLHTGEPAIGPTGYVGMDVHRTARICSAGHGGQVLLSQTTRDLVEHELPPNVSLRDLGEYRLKDMPRTERLFQLIIPDLPSDFPPLESLNTFPTHQVVGTIIQSRYRIDAEIGHGGMGIVYRAHDIVLDRDVAVKVLSAPALESRARLLREAQATAKLNHPNIVSVYDAGDSAGVPFIVMELAPGHSLHTHPPKSPEETIAIARQICAALEHAHAQGIIHRDLKPENVLLTHDGTAKLMDFGLARSRGAARITQEGTIVGTVFYLSPEQAQGLEVDGRSDLYSLGVMLYELTTGRLPFTSDDPLAIITQHLNSPVVPPTTLRADIPPSLEAVILKLLAKKPEDRFASAHEVMAALADIAEGHKPRIADAPRNNLPVQLSSFVGREREMAQVRRLLVSARLVSLTGAGGCGKTRLAIRVAGDAAADYPDGVWLVELATLSDPSLVTQKIASALGLQQEPNRPPMETLTDYLSARALLLIFDNCEHMIDAVAQLGETLLHACPDLHVLTTSREALGIAGETAFRVPSLATPDVQRLPPVESVAQYDAVRLFIDRAVSVSPEFQLTEQNARGVAQICHRLDGIPLAIELAAARVKALSVEQIATRLDNRFRLLTGGSRTALPRQQTLRALIDWSYDLLSDAERMLLRRLSVFAGGWTLEAAEAICTCNNTEAIDVLDLLLRLVDKSLVVAEKPDDETRYRMLETIRQYARDRLMSLDEAKSLRACHLDYFLRLVEQAAPELRGAHQEEWSNRLETEHDNLRAALEWASESGEASRALRLAAGLVGFWEMRSYFTESRAWLERALSIGGTATSPERARAMRGLGRLDVFQGWYADAKLHLETALALYRELGHKPQVANTLQTLGEVAAEQGDLDEASKRFADSLALFEELRDKHGMAGLYLSQGELVRLRGDAAQAEQLYSKSLALDREVGNERRTAIALHNLGYLALHRNEHDRAALLFRDGLSVAARFNNKRQIAHCLAGLAGSACAAGDLKRAVRLLGAADAQLKAIQAQMDLADRMEFERYLDQVRAQLDEKTFDAAWSVGSAMTTEQAVADALELPSV